MDEQPREHTASERAGVWAAGASLAAAVLASACCIGPLVLAAFGASTLGMAAAFEQVRPVLLGVTGLLLGGGFYCAYFWKPTCAPGEACAVQNPQLTRVNRGVLWLATVVVVAVAFFPAYAGSLLAGSSQAVVAESKDGSSTVALHIEGMTCGACAAGVENALAAVPGVQSASVSYEEQRAVVAVDTASPPTTEALIAAVKTAGYTASRERESEASPPKVAANQYAQ